MIRTTQITSDIQRGRQVFPYHGQAAPSFFKSADESIETILNRLISKIDYGYKWKNPKTGEVHPVHCNKKEELLALYTHRLKDRWGNPKQWLSGITHEKWDRHF